MFENLTDKLQRAFKNLRGQGTLTEENIGEALEIRMALLEADVNLNVVKQLIDRSAPRLSQEVMTALSPSEQVIKIVRDELVAILGKDTAKLKFASQPPTVVLMAGLQGSGKQQLPASWRTGSSRADTARSSLRRRLSPSRSNSSRSSPRPSKRISMKAQ
jgi:signal recognition particle GTPase